MKKIDKIINFDAERFKRVVGVKPITFQVMVEEYKASEIERKKHIKLAVENLNYVKKIGFFLWFCRKLSAWLRYFQNQLSLDTIILL